jgi:hypothetical protein
MMAKKKDDKKALKVKKKLKPKENKSVIRALTAGAIGKKKVEKKMTKTKTKRKTTVGDVRRAALKAKMARRRRAGN